MYSYEIQKPELLTDKGQTVFLKVRDHVLYMLKISGAVRQGEAISSSKVSYGDSWTGLAIFDRMVEIGDLREITDDNVCGQDRVFVKAE